MNLQAERPELLLSGAVLQGETGTEAEIILPDYCPNVLRILQTDAEASVESAVPSSDTVTVEGTVEHTVLYLAEDGGEICSARQQSRFRYVFEAGQTDGTPQVTVRTRNAVCRALSPKKLSARATVLLQLQTDRTQSVEMPDGDADLERKICRRQAVCPVASARKPLRISDEIEGDDRTVKSVLFSRIICRETEQKPLEDKLIVKADMTLDLLCGAQDGSVFSLRRTVPVSQIADLPGAEEGDVFLTRWEPSLSVFTPREREEGKQQIAYDVQIDISVAAYRVAEIEWTEDAYSVKRQAECIRQTVTTQRLIPVQVSGILRETVETGTATEILSVCATPQIRAATYRQEDARMVCDGVWEVKLLMKDAEGTPVGTVREIPFSLSTQAEAITISRNATVLTVSDLSAAATDAAHTEIRGEWHWNGAVFGEETLSAVTRVDLAEPRPRPKDTVALYYAEKGESVWQIAKSHACPCDEFKRYNQISGDTLTEDRMLTVIYG